MALSFPVVSTQAYTTWWPIENLPPYLHVSPFGPVVQCDLGGKDVYHWQRVSIHSTVVPPSLVPERYGLVGVLDSIYEQDRANDHILLIRPDDVWLTILSQFRYYVRGNAETLRHHFTASSGKQTLTAQAKPGNYGTAVREMVDNIHDKSVDKSLRDWVMPAFSTTSDTDRTAAAVYLMDALSPYFDYQIRDSGTAPIPIDPSAPRTSPEEDWQLILSRLEKLRTYGIETSAWYHLLRPVITHFIAALDPETRASPAENDFWSKITQHEGGFGHGSEFYYGWINAFNVFTEDGQWMGYGLRAENVSDALYAQAMDENDLFAPSEANDASSFWMTHLVSPKEVFSRRPLVLDGSPFHAVDLMPFFGLPNAYALVDVSLLKRNDSAKPCRLLAGVVAMHIEAASGSASGTALPLVGWWLYED
ncbi:hypothetical protein MKEN_00932500 [Mycena kentingensis (nom. inval.)]|nr:hypothetical protein MKEN_00932500 [Mycena kentingensis (nom. inval.)]